MQFLKNKGYYRYKLKKTTTIKGREKKTKDKWQITHDDVSNVDFF